jgi:hypothetical protein
MKPEMTTPQYKGQQAFSVCIRLLIIAGIIITLLYSVTVYHTGHFAILGWQSLKPWLAGWR